MGQENPLTLDSSKDRYLLVGRLAETEVESTHDIRIEFHC
jgi:hypothetical protein